MTMKPLTAKEMREAIEDFRRLGFKQKRVLDSLLRVRESGNPLTEQELALLIDINTSSKYSERGITVEEFRKAVGGLERKGLIEWVEP